MTSPGASPARAASHEDAQLVVGEFAAFFSSIFVLQAEMAGVASVVREYLSWARTLVAAGGGAAPGGAAAADPNCAAVLKMLESRVLELQEMAETGPPDAWATLLDALKRVTADEQLCATIGAFEAEAQQRVERTKQFFQESYDVSMRLSEQMPDEQGE
ncbi:hypothetical protein PG984_015594 [Apiospora sp. TS-2023a]